MEIITLHDLIVVDIRVLSRKHILDPKCFNSFYVH